MLVVIDENLPRDFNAVFVSQGYKTIHIRDEMPGALDSAVFDFAQKHSAVLATSDVFFAQSVHTFEAEHNGIFLIRLPSFLSLKVRTEELDSALASCNNLQLHNAIVVVSPGRIRTHRKS